jgi:MSHA biogenesis protein MshJ
MKKRLQKWWQKRSLRERLVVQLAALVIVATVIDTIALAPTRKEAARVRGELAGARSELERIRADIEEQARQSQGYIQGRKKELQQRREAAENVIHEAQVDLISPQQMKRQLAAILEKFPQMSIVAVNSLAPVPLGFATPSKSSDSHAAASAQVPGVAPNVVAGLFQHGMEVTVEGHYLDLIGYLQTLEHAPHRVYWRDLDLAVNEKGMPVTKIGIFTLSRDPTWLSL